MPSSAALSGKTGSVNSDGVVSEAKMWRANLRCRALDASNFDGAGWEAFIEGLKGGSFEFNSQTDLIAVGPVTALVLTLDSGPSISGAGIISENPIEVEVDGLLMYNYRGEFDGVITSV